ncbi:MAG: flagellar protein [Spirochaetales bacterium]|nr:flagellar protein [Spirochaetales bacterium]
MKRGIFFGIFLLVTCSLAFSLTSTLIDFSELGADYGDPPRDNERTLINYSREAGAQFTEEEKAKMVSSLALGKWRVVLASSSATVARQSLCFTKEAETTANARDYKGQDMKSKKILGVRIKFPESNFNSYAIIKPPFEIQAYQDKDTVAADGSLTVADADIGKGEKFDGIGVLKNVGVIKSIDMTIYGANYPHAVEVILMNEKYEEKRYACGYLDYEGWGNRGWVNPNYVGDVRNRELQKYPLYPRAVPFIKFIGLIIYRDANAIGGDFITYVKDIKVTYDQAVLDLEEPQIDDESIWHILQDRNEARKQAEYKRLGARMVLEVLEEQKMDGYQKE